MNYKDFRTPDRNFFPRPLWFWNDLPTDESLADILDTAEDLSSYGGFGILPYDACGMEYMGEEYLNAYEFVLKKAKEKGLKICLYDEWWFPSGSAGGLLKKMYPEACAKRLDKIEYPVDGHIEITLPDGKLMAVTAMHEHTGQIVNLREFISDGKLVWDAEDGHWKLMFFVCVLSDWDHVNYLDPAAVNKFIEITHETYYRRFSEYFGTVIDSSFYDEPQMYALDGRMWTDDFNDHFIRTYGCSPDILYPALWYDIGENTASARNMFFKLRADLYAKGFPKVVQEWCTAHNISLTGHVDQEEVINPAGITGDLMKSFKYQDIPGFDEISTPGRAGKIYKLVSSAAYNWDKELVMSECYGAMPEDTSIQTMYNEAMEQYAKGMNLFVPHAVWLNAQREKIIFAPELSYRNPRYKDTLKPFNEFCARMSSLMQGGRHIADIALLYPVYGLNSSYYFDWDGSPYNGGPAPDYFDYQDIGDWLSGSIRKDFTYLHPEVFDEKCTVENGGIRLNNVKNYEEYKVLILPGTDTMSMSNLLKVRDFYEAGGTVIAASMLPSHSVEMGKDNELTDIIRWLFGDVSTAEDYSVNIGENGGRAYFIPHPDAELLHKVMTHSEVRFDIDLTVEAKGNGLISYIHKEKDGCDIIYLVNCNSDSVRIQVSINSSRSYELWDPHDGSIKVPEKCTVNNDNQVYVLNINANHSLVMISH